MSPTELLLPPLHLIESLLPTLRIDKYPPFLNILERSGDRSWWSNTSEYHPEHVCISEKCRRSRPLKAPLAPPLEWRRGMPTGPSLSFLLSPWLVRRPPVDSQIRAPQTEPCVSRQLCSCRCPCPSRYRPLASLPSMLSRALAVMPGIRPPLSRLSRLSRMPLPPPAARSYSAVGPCSVASQP